MQVMHKTVTVTKMQPVEVQEKQVTITLTEDEAMALLAVTARIGGDGVNSPRKYFADLAEHLEVILNQDNCAADYSLVNPEFSGDIYFLNFPGE